MVNQYIKIYNGEIISLNIVKAIVADRHQTVVVTTKGHQHAIANIELRAAANVLQSHGFSPIIELVGNRIHSPLIHDDGAPYPAIVNMNLVTRFKESWEGRIHFSDESWIETATSYGAMLSVLKITPLEFNN